MTDFPYKKYFLNEVELQAYKRFLFVNLLEGLNNYVTIEFFKDDNNRDYPHNYEFGHDKKVKRFVVKDMAYHEVDILTDLFSENVRVKSNVKGQPSPYDYWENEKNKDKIIGQSKRMNISGAKIINKYSSFNSEVYRLRESIYSLSRECTQFKCTLAAKIIGYTAFLMSKDISKVSVLDPTSGWGDRLIGALSVGVKKYVGVDSNEALQQSYIDICRELKPIAKEKLGVSTIVKTYHAPFEKFKIDKKFDIVFTSPPFGDWEEYTKENTEQCASVYKSNEEWIEKWLFPMVEKMLNFCNKGGILCLYLSDTRTLKCTEKLVKHMKSVEGAEYLGVMGCSKEKSNRKLPLWFWKHV